MSTKKRFLYIFVILFLLSITIVQSFALQDLSFDLSSLNLDTGVHDVRVVSFNGNDTSEAWTGTYDNSATYTVTYNLTHVSVVDEITSVRQGSSLTLQFDTDTGYVISSYNITMNGENINSYYNPRTNIFYIDNVQGNIIVTMSALSTSSDAYKQGYNDGQFAGKTSLEELVPLIFGSVSGLFMSTLGNMNVMGISLLSLVSLVMLAVVFIFILKAVIK